MSEELRVTQEAKTKDMEDVKTIAKAMLDEWEAGSDGDDVFAEYTPRLKKALSKASLVKTTERH